ncbi:hypothetical protein [Sphingomonas adhaesiva]|uniref:hypothetical protein n=1 Tax=Sphingomonas adhaesiva TaxID=28212 RepID=UPI002FF75742
MTKEQIGALVRGATLYHTLAEGASHGAGVAIFYFDPNGRAAARLPSGKLMAGVYRVEDGGYVVDWDNGLQNSRSILAKEGGLLVCRNAVDGQLRSTVERIMFGDPEDLAGTARA